jgi:putative restriction endonuclease
MAEKQKNWTREETIVAFNLYCKIPFRESTKNNPLIIKFAKIIDRTPSAIAMKIGNLGRFDPELRERGITGLVNGSKMDEEIWNEFNGDWNRLAFESERILAKLQGESVDAAVEGKPLDEDLPMPAGTDRQTIIKARVNQDFFRSAILSAYDGKCCITGLSVPQLLVASHIIPWSVRADTRTDPHNGLLLNPIHDKAFDAGLITITTDYEVKISRYIREFLPDKIINEWFFAYAGKKIATPEKFLPSKEYLRWHNENIFKG